MQTEDLKGYEFTEDGLIPLIVLILGTMGGRGSKQEVEKKLYGLFREKFKNEHWNKLVSHGVPRWKHYIAWGKERAKQIHGYIEAPKKAGRGIWQLTSKGEKYCALIREELYRTNKGGDKDGH